MDTTHDLVELFHRQVLATPDAVAVVDDTASWTYAQLDKATDHVADRLRSVYGVGRDVLVGVLMGHNIQYIVACLAALKAGGAFLVLEVAYPPGLLADVIEDALPPVILTSSEYADRVPAHTPRILLERGMSVDDLAALPTSDPLITHPEPASPLPASTDLDRLAFVSYSSGTTGRPKGICNPHSAPVQSYALRFKISDIGPGGRVACNVFFVWEILRPLLKGGAVVTVPDETSYDPVGLVKFLAQHEITETLMTPTLLATVLARYPDFATRLPHLRTLWLNGEVVSVDLARRATAALSPPGAAPVRLLNCYSVSETHEIACGDIRAALEHLPSDATVCPVGPPMDPEHTYVLDEEGNLLPPGAGGELYVGGPLLARGYLNRPETTAEVFLPNRFNGGVGRIYRTGDKARILTSTGELEISGRVGGMIKVRGYTVHPAAVESAIVKHLAVRSCVVLADKEGLERQLVAYVVRDVEGGAASGPDLRSPLQINGDGHSPLARRLLADHLAHYMIPVFWVELDMLPTHKVSGKIDVKGLPSLRAGPSGSGPGPSPPETPPADTLAQILWGNGAATAAPGGVQNDPATQIDENDVRRHWGACLNLPEASIDPQQFDFFDLGGHSLALAELSNRLSAAYGVNVPLLALASKPTMAGHIAAIASAARAASSATVKSVDNSLLKAIIESDTVLPSDFAISEKKQPQRISEATDIFLTGATGFLGAFLLAELVATTKATIHCLVRGSSAFGHTKPGSGMARLRKHLLGLGLWTDTIVDRIEIVTGDLALPSLGLGSAQFDDLAKQVQAVVHAGAHVNLVYPYDALRDANVGGTKEVLRLAARGQATVHYVSTNGVLPPAKHAWNEDDTPVSTPGDVVDKIPDGYGQTKWVAEQLVAAAAQQGLPARIYRPGTLGGHSHTGATNPRDVVTALIVESLRIGYSPNVDGWRVEMTPVDAAASKILGLANIDGDKTTDNSVLHIGDAEAILAKDLFARLALLGYETQPVDWDEWVARWNEDQSDAPPAASAARDDSDISPMDILRAGMPSVDFLKLVILLDDTKTNSLLDGDAEKYLSLDLELLTTYTRHFYSRGWLHKGPKLSVVPKVAKSVVPVPKGPLAGRVAVVVGASSGIGAAIAAALANDGAHIALGSRRIGELKTLQATLEAQFPGTKILPQATDVTDAAQVKALVEAAKTQLGPVDILIVCAGVMYFTMMSSVRSDEWDRTVDVNCKGLLHCISATLPGMLERAKPINGASEGAGHSPHIVAISSDAGRKVFPGLGVYSGSKFFVEAVLQALRVETAGTGLRVTSVQPGNTATELLGLSTDPEAMEKFGAPTGAQVLSPADVASAVVYALRQPAHVSVNEVMIEPRDEPI
ncbi:nonribosomal peptide synthetase 10 [Ophiostoma piceae UAMH 11346]|uniref:Nonribosomal peptide synthetase 10 n=1 Tax=Ophiostoma piceae (strain UAMH 11346) TaxID=1262450 RepID=S3C3X5_OPHP1|nr:nonribosomal peptide synthetase 10 [Ophiostoma piceae UAMH 11346]